MLQSCKTVRNMRLGTAFATTVAVAAAPRGVSADGNSVSSKLQVHVSTPALENVALENSAQHMAIIILFYEIGTACALLRDSTQMMEMDWILLDKETDSRSLFASAA